MAELTHPPMKAYSQRIGADFVCIDQSNSTTPHWEKFQIADLLSRYERVLYLDTDLLVRADCPNLFDVVPVNDLGMFNEAPFTLDRKLSLVDACKEYDIRLRGWDGRYWNTGVMIIPRTWKFLFRKPAKEAFNFYEQGYINARIHQELEKAGNELRVFDLPYKFNRMACMDRFTGEERFASFIMHYAGFPSLQFVLGLIEKDVKKWSEDAWNEWKYPRHIVVDVQGGLGDQVEAQPAVRFMARQIYPGEDITVLTHFPVLFQDIAVECPNVRVFEHGQWQPQPDTPYFRATSLPGPETSMWAHVSHLLCHSADYTSMALMRRTLPASEKSIQIKVHKEWLKGARAVCGDDLESLVLVHAGKHWESKTFPLAWWQEVADGIQQAGHRVCLIGRNELSRGVVPVVARPGMVDARDLLSLEELIALLSQAKVLVSNDSAPVHLAGAFDNWIVLIPTCKHPDHVVPYRNGRVDYKTEALYKRLAIDDYAQAPTEVHAVPGHKWPKDCSVYLPEALEVVGVIGKVVKT